MFRHILWILLFLLVVNNINAQVHPSGQVGTTGDTNDYIAKIQVTIKNSQLPEEAKAKLTQTIQETVNKGAPARELKIITERYLSSATESSALENWCQLIAGASDRGLPINSVLDKIKEGLAKNVPPARIDQALNLMIERLLASKGMLDSFVKSGKINPDVIGMEATEILSEALWRGIPPDALKGVCEKIQASQKKEDMLGAVKVSVLSLSKLQSLNVPSGDALKLVKEVLDKPGYHNYYLYDLVEIIRIAIAQKKRTPEEIITMVQNSVAKDVNPVQLVDIMGLGPDGLAVVEKELARTEKDVEKSRKQVKDASARVAQDVPNAKEEMERAKDEMEKNIERMKELRDLMERMREEIEHLKYYQHYQHYYGE